ncbi:MAG: alpha-galactosidase [Lentisphaeria bacterium]|nr:alpha-galactosidase [Lentisphaeria bacterium]
MKTIFLDDEMPFAPCFAPPLLRGATPQWSAPQETSAPAEREGRKGELARTIRTAPGMELAHETFFSDDGRLMLCRAALKNTGDAVLAVERLSVCAVMCNLDGAALHCGKRLKHEKPYSTIHHGEEFSADPDLLIQRPGYTMLLSWVETHLHPAMIRMRNNPSAGNYFENQILSADADLHGQEIAPGETLFTQTLAVRRGSDYNDLLNEHAAAVCAHYGIPPRRETPPFVLSSWHYWGPHIDEEILEAELASAEERRIPGDVYQVDAGYHTLFGDWLETNERFPHGLAAMANQIARHGMTPGIWLAPFMVNPESKTAKAHPEWILRKENGSPVCYRVSQACHVLDLSLASVRMYLEETFRAMYDAGFRYFKIDFTRSYFTDEETSRIADRKSNLTLSYRQAVEAIRRGIGKTSFLNVCGGHAGCLVGLADSQRTGADTYARWQSSNPTPAWHRVRQGMFRAWQGAWRFNDPDAAAIRLCGKPLTDTPHGRLALGDLTDDEARLMVLHQFIAGGVPALGENLQELQEDRLRMMRRVVPSCGIPARLLDPFNTLCPSRFLTRLPARNGLPAQSIISVMNVTEENLHPCFVLDAKILPCPVKRYMVWDMTHNKLIGVYAPGEEFYLGCVPPHGAAVAAVTPLGADAVPVGSDGHYGFAEIAAFSAKGEAFSGTMDSRWPGPVKLAVAVPGKDDWIVRQAELPPQGGFDAALFED